MAFNLATAKPVTSSFNLSTAKPVATPAPEAEPETDEQKAVRLLSAGEKRALTPAEKQEYADLEKRLASSKSQLPVQSPGGEAVGALEEGAHLLSGGLGTLGGGLNYLGTLAATGDPEAAKAVMQETHDKLTYQPRSPAGAANAAAEDNVVSAVPAFAQNTGDAIRGKQPGKLRDAVATVVESAIEGAPNLLAVRRGAPGEKPQVGFKRTPEAEALIRQGVDLTPGQMNPKGMMNRLEQAGQHLWVVGDAIKNARDNAVKTFQKLLFNKAAGKKLTGGDVNDLVDQTFNRFDELYAPIKDVQVEAPGQAAVAKPGGVVSRLSGRFKQAAGNRGIQTDDATRASTSDWLENKLTELQAKPGEPLTAGDLLALRSGIRRQIRENGRSTSESKNDSAKLMSAAEDAVTEELNSKLPQQVQDFLKEVDSHYADFKVLQKAVLKAKDAPNGFTPENLSQAIKESTNENVYAKGGGRFREDAKNAKATLAPTQQANGSVLATLGIPAAAIAAKPLFGVPAAIASLMLSTTKTGRRFARGETAMQRGYQDFAASTSLNSLKGASAVASRETAEEKKRRQQAEALRR